MIDCYQCKTKPADPKLVAFCSPECKVKYNNGQEDKPQKKKTSFNGMSGEEIKNYAMNRFKQISQDKKAYAEQLDREWEEKQKQKNSGENLKKNEPVKLVFEDEETFNLAVQIFSEESEKEKDSGQQSYLGAQKGLI